MLDLDNDPNNNLSIGLTPVDAAELPYNINNLLEIDFSNFEIHGDLKFQGQATRETPASLPNKINGDLVFEENNFTKILNYKPIKANNVLITECSRLHSIDLNNITTETIDISYNKSIAAIEINNTTAKTLLIKDSYNQATKEGAKLYSLRINNCKIDTVILENLPNLTNFFVDYQMFNTQSENRINTIIHNNCPNTENNFVHINGKFNTLILTKEEAEIRGYIKPVMTLTN